MLMMTDAARKAHAKLIDELSWLKKEHPEKTALIGLAEAHIDTIRMAGSCSSGFIYSTSHGMPQ